MIICGIIFVIGNLNKMTNIREGDRIFSLPNVFATIVFFIVAIAIYLSTRKQKGKKDDEDR